MPEAHKPGRHGKQQLPPSMLRCCIRSGAVAGIIFIKKVARMESKIATCYEKRMEY